MKLEQTETVVRYQVRFDPDEVEILKQHPKWQHRIGVRKSGWRGGDATLTKTELSEVCDALGINGREWLATAQRDSVPSQTVRCRYCSRSRHMQFMMHNADAGYMCRDEVDCSVATQWSTGGDDV